MHFLRAKPVGVLLDLPQNGQSEALAGAHAPGSAAGLAQARDRFGHPPAKALPRHLQKPETRDRSQLGPGPVRLHAVPQPVLDGLVVLALLHVDEVDHDEAGDVAHAHLPRRLLGGLEVGLERCALDRLLPRRLSGVHVDGDQRLCLADDDGSAGLQRNDRIEHAVEIGLDLVLGEERRLVAVQLHVLGAGRHDQPHEVLRDLVALFAVDQDLADLVAAHVPDGAHDQVALLVDLRRSHRLEGQLANLLPEPKQVFVVALDLGLGAAGSGGPDNQARPLRKLQLAHDLLELLAVAHIGDLAADAAMAAGVGHQHAVPAREGNVGCQRGALVSALLLDRLHQDDLTRIDDFLDLVALRTRLACGAGLLRVRFRLIVRIAALPAAAAPAPGLGSVRFVRTAVGRLGILLAGFAEVNGFTASAGRFGLGRARTPPAPAGRIVGSVLLVLFAAAARVLLGNQGLSVGDRDLVVVRMDLGKAEKSVPVSPVLDESRLKRRLDSRHPRKIDVSGNLPLVRGFKVEFLDSASVDHRDAGFLRVGGVDEHFLGHILHWRRARPPRRGGIRPAPAPACGAVP